MYRLGQGVPQNDNKAAHWYREAAAKGDASAEENLGDLYNIGRGVPRDYDKAAHWYRRAAAQGDAGAEYNLGLLYYLGRGVLRDYVASYKWLALAAAGGGHGAADRLAVRMMGSLRRSMTAAQVARAQNEAIELRRKHANAKERR